MMAASAVGFHFLDEINDALGMGERWRAPVPCAHVAPTADHEHAALPFESGQRAEWPGGVGAGLRGVPVCHRSATRNDVERATAALLLLLLAFLGGTEEEGYDAIHAQLVAFDTKLHKTIGTPRMVAPKAQAASIPSTADNDWRIIGK